MLSTFLSQLRTHPVILASPRDERIIKNLRNLLKRQRKLCKMQSEERMIDTFTIAKSNTIDCWQQSSVKSYDGSTRSSSSGSSSGGGASELSPSSVHPTITSNHRYSRRKDSAIGMPPSSPPTKDLKPSTSSPALPFFSRSRRLSGGSQRTVSEGSAWTAKMNYSIKTIKRSVPTVCHSIWQGIHQHGETVGKNSHCICGSPQNHAMERRSRKFATCSLPAHSLMRSASRVFMFDTMKNVRKSNHTQVLNTPIPGRHPNPLCPMHPIPQTPTPAPLPRMSHSAIDSTIYEETTCSSTESPSSSYKPFILQYRSEIIAQQFCIIEQRMLQSVTWDELAELRWKNRRPSSSAAVRSMQDHGANSSGGVEQLIHHFNMASSSIQQMIKYERVGYLLLSTDLSVGCLRDCADTVFRNPSSSH